MTRKIFYYAGQVVHPFYVEQFSESPSNFEAIFHEKSQGNSLRKDFRSLNRLRKPLENLNRLIRRNWPNLNWHQPSVGCSCDLIHSAQRLLKNINQNYVVDFEQVGAFGFHDRAIMNNQRYKNDLINAFSDKKLVKILPWTEMALESFKTYLADHPLARDILSKTEVLLPAIKPRVESTKKLLRSDKTRLLFIGSPFLFKGGYEVLEAVRKLSESGLDVQLDIVTKCQISNFKLTNYINIHSRISQLEMNQLYKNAHILLMPQHMDTLGYVIMEAFANAIPVVVTNNFSTPELVDGKNGLIVDNPISFWDQHGIQRYDWWEERAFETEAREAVRAPDYVESIQKAVLEIRDNFEEFSFNALQTVTIGELSFSKRLVKLGKIYHDCLS